MDTRRKLFLCLCFLVCSHLFGVSVSVGKRYTEFFKYFRIYHRCAVIYLLYRDIACFFALEYADAHVAGSFSECNIVNAHRSYAAVGYLLYLGAVNRYVICVSLFKKHRKVVYNIVIGKIVYAVYLRSK